MTDQLPQSPKEPVPRWQAEVEEILDQSDRESTSFEKARAAAIATRYKAPDRARQVSDRAGSRMGDGLWLVIAVILGISAWIAGLHWPLAGRVLAFASIAFFIGFIVNAIMRSRRRSQQPKLWRGQDLSSPDSGPRLPGSRSSRDDDDPPLVGSGR
ncbi:MAG: TrbC/VirB2 family protein [Thermomicrobiales bacterium]|nr:TrbC/VirB2 family protein [Thermomicrobiales bacterium]